MLYLILGGIFAKLLYNTFYDIQFKNARYVEFYTDDKTVGIMREEPAGLITHKFGNTSFDDYFARKIRGYTHTDHWRYIKLAMKFKRDDRNEV